MDKVILVKKLKDIISEIQGQSEITSLEKNISIELAAMILKIEEGVVYKTTDEKLYIDNIDEQADYKKMRKG